MKSEQMPQEQTPEFPYLTRLEEMVEQVFTEEQAHLKGSMGANYLPGCATTWGVRQAVDDIIRRKKKKAAEDAPVKLSQAELSTALEPFVSLATILTQAGENGDEIDSFAVGNVLSALCFYANKKTGGYPSTGEYF